MDLTDAQWELLKPLLEKEQQGKGRPRVPAREVLSGVLWILRTGAPWKDLPDRYPPYQTCHRRYQEWVDEGKLDEVLSLLANDLKERGKIDVTECFIDGSFAPSKKGAQVLAKLSGVRARTCLPVGRGHGNYRRCWSSNRHRLA